MAVTHDTLQVVIDELADMIVEITNKQADTQRDLAAVIDQVIATGNVDMKTFSTLRRSTELYTMVLDELHVRHKAARLSLWDYDLDKAQKELGAAREKWSKAKADLKQVVADKAKFVRGQDYKTLSTDEKALLNSMEVLLTDARAQEELAQRNRAVAIQNLNKLKEQFNMVAGEFGREPFPPSVPMDGY